MVNSVASGTGVFRYARKMENASESARLAASAVMAPTGWRVFIEQPLVYIRLQSTGYYAFALGLMLLAFAGAVLGARAFAGASPARSRKSSAWSATSRRTAARPKPS